MLSKNDCSLLRAIQSGAAVRDAALQLMFGEPGLRSAVIHYAKVNGGNTEDGKDLFQEAVMVFDRCIRQGKFNEKCSLRTYFISIAKWHWANMRRKKAHNHTALPDLESLGWVDSPEAAVLTKEKQQVLQQAVAALGERNARLLTLYKMTYSMEEIAQQMGLSSAAMAKKEVHRSRERLRTLIQQQPHMMEVLQMG